MSAWKDFLDDVLGPPDQPGKVMICFMNRYLEGLDGIKYKIKYDGKERSGTTTTANYCVEITPKSFKPIETFVWSRKALAYKKLDDVTPDAGGRKKLVRKVMKTFKVDARTEKLNNNARAAKRPSKPTAPPPPGPSPKTPQGVQATQGKDESGQPMVSVSRAVPGQITVEQLKKIFPAANSQHLQSVADECNRDLIKFNLDTPRKRAHFFAQIRGEIGSAMHPKTEDWEYSPETLKAFSSYYKSHPEEADKDGHLRAPSRGKKRGKIIRRANQKNIGEKHFLKLNGNRANHPSDGYDFRGRGMIQITGYEKYSKFSEEYSDYFPGATPDTVNNPEIVNSTPFAIRSAIWFWNYREAYLAIKTGEKSEVRAVTILVNGGVMGLKERQEAFVVTEAAFK